jgi:hypothetical protein
MFRGFGGLAQELASTLEEVLEEVNRRHQTEENNEG